MITFFDIIPELVLAGAFLKGFREFYGTGAQVPEEDPEGIDVNRVVIFSCEQAAITGESYICLQYVRGQCDEKKRRYP